LSYKLEGTTIFKDISFKIKENEILGLLGANGAGKTTLINIILGQINPIMIGQESEIVLKREDNSVLSIKDNLKHFRQHIRFCPQSDILQDLLTVKEHLILTTRLLGLEDYKNSGILSILEQVGLSDKINAPVGTLSPGGKRKLSIAISLVGNPRLLIMDEPTSNLDLKTREKIWAIIQSLVKDENRMSVLVSTQHIEEAENLSNRILIIKDTSKIICDSPHNLKKQTGMAMRFVTNQKNKSNNLRES